jgi:hypothetical protein
MYDSALLDRSDRIIAKAWADEKFKAALKADPKAALASQGIELPEGLTLNVLENTETSYTLVLPKPPDLALVGEELDQSSEVARCGGGGCGCGGCGCGGGGCQACNCLCW